MDKWPQIVQISIASIAGLSLLILVINFLATGRDIPYGIGALLGGIFGFVFAFNKPANRTNSEHNSKHGIRYRYGGSEDVEEEDLE